jgi:ATP-dependent helicase HepA
LNSFRPEVAATLVDEIRRQDDDTSLDEFMLSVFDHYSIHVEEIALRTYKLGSAGVLADSFPGLPAEGLAVTADRQRALAREDVQFLTWDHPLVTGAIDLLLGSEKGNSSFAEWPDGKAAGLYVEAIYLLECIAPPHLHIDRFLPPTPLRILVDHQGREARMAGDELKPGDAHALMEQPEVREDLLPKLIEKTHELAGSRIPGLIDAARKEMTAQLDHEIVRLKELQKVNRTVRDEEIELLIEQRRALDEHLKNARLRLDAVRLIQRG